MYQLFARLLKCKKYLLLKKITNIYRKLELADFDDVSSELPVGLLICADYYFCFFTNKVIKQLCGPVACETILGWVLSGPLSSEHSLPSCLT